MAVHSLRAIPVPLDLYMSNRLIDDLEEPDSVTASDRLEKEQLQDLSRLLPDA